MSLSSTYASDSSASTNIAVSFSVSLDVGLNDTLLLLGEGMGGGLNSLGEGVEGRGEGLDGREEAKLTVDIPAGDFGSLPKLSYIGLLKLVGAFPDGSCNSVSSGL